MHVAVYCRISRDAQGRAEGVETQRRNGLRLAAQHWPDVEHVAYVDNDISAATPGTRRPGYEQMVTAMRRGEVLELVCAEQSRLTRQPAEWEDLMVTLAAAGIDQVHTTRTGAVEVKGSRLIGRILAAVDAEEVERTRARIRDRHDALAAEGRPAGGTSYGYRHIADPDGRKRLVVDAEQAEAARWAAAKVLAGWSLSSVAEHLAERDVPTRRGGAWSTTTVKTMLTRPTITGLRVHRGEIVGDGDWEPILDRDTWQQVCAVLAGPRTVAQASGGTFSVAGAVGPRRRRYLLTGGTAVCGRCGAALIAQQRKSRAGGRSPSYLCVGDRGGCGGLGIIADALEGDVLALVHNRLTTPALAELVSAGDDRRRVVLDAQAGLRARRDELGALWAAEDISTPDWRAALAGLDERDSGLAGELAALPTSSGLDVDDLLDRWDGLTLEERRHVVGRVVVSVIVGPAKPGTRRFDPERVTIEWRG